MAKAGEKIGDYVLVRRLGKGNSKDVWLAEKTNRFGTTRVALAILDGEFDEEALIKEAQIWRSVSSHPNVNRLIDVEDIDGQVVILSDCVEGGNLAKWIGEQPGGEIGEPRALRIVHGILSGLHHLHSQTPAIIHRDLKPSNVLMRGESPVLTDFGLSRWLDDTRTRHIAGTPSYMAPQTFDHNYPYSARSDLWAVGVLMHRILSGALPFGESGMSPLSMMNAIQTAAPKPLPATVSRAAKQIVARALQRIPEDRYESASQMLAAIEEAMGSAAPSGTVTVMFTDIVGSTGLKGRMQGRTSPEKDQRFLETVKAPVDEIVLEAIGVDGFIAKDTGDGFLIAFSNAESAVLCALEIQRSLAATPISVPGGSVDLRIGLNTGHMVYRNNDYNATAVDKAKRVQEAAQPGSVMVSHETHALISGKLKDVVFVKSDGIPLKGLGDDTLYIASLTEADVGGQPLQSRSNPEASAEAVRFAAGDFPIRDADVIVAESALPQAEPALVAESVTAPSVPPSEHLPALPLQSREPSRPVQPVGQTPNFVLRSQERSAPPSTAPPIVPATAHASSSALQPSIRPAPTAAKKGLSDRPMNAKVMIGAVAALFTLAFIGSNWPRIAAALHLQSAARPALPAESRQTFQLAPGVTMEMARIPAGDFLMGDDDQTNNPRHKEFLAEFYMQTTPVTVAQYRAFCAAKRLGIMPPAPSFNKDWSLADHPIVNVTFKDAQEFCAWAEHKTGRKIRLPTEKEWEKAARGTDGNRYPWGNEGLTKANAGHLLWSSLDSAKSGTNTVGRFPSNEFGLYDMAGNVWQWCDSLYLSLYGGEHDWRVVRGGSWNGLNPEYFRAAYRDWNSPLGRSSGGYGFRCASGP